MLSTDRGLSPNLCSVVLAFCGCAILSAQPARAPQPLSCPATVTVNESITPPSPWQSRTPSVERTFERISVYNGKDGGEEFELAPDDERKAGNSILQTWNLKPYRTMNIFIRCRYRNTGALLWMNLPAEIGQCKLRFQADSRGRIVGKSSMECH